MFIQNMATASVSLSAVSSAKAPTGTVLPFAGSAVPSNWLLCNGQAVSRATYSALFAVVGTTFGAGDGVSTFNVPNIDSRAVIGTGTGYALGATGGSSTRTLSLANMPAHSHTGTTNTDGAHSHTQRLGTVDDKNFTSNSGQNPPSDGPIASQTYTIDSTGSDHSHSFTTSSAGSGTAFSIMNPYVVMLFIIKT